MEAYVSRAAIDTLSGTDGGATWGHGGDDHGLYEDALNVMELNCVR